MCPYPAKPKLFNQIESKLIKYGIVALMNRTKTLRSYRNLIRASNITFKDDPVAHKAALAKIKNEYIQDKTLSREEYLKKIQFAKDVAHILRCNVVQGVATNENNFKLKVHEDSELGDNSDSFGKSPCETLKQTK